MYVAALFKKGLLKVKLTLPSRRVYMTNRITVKAKDRQYLSHTEYFSLLFRERLVGRHTEVSNSCKLQSTSSFPISIY